MNTTTVCTQDSSLVRYRLYTRISYETAKFDLFQISSIGTFHSSMDDSFRRLPTVSIKLDLSLLLIDASLLFCPLNHPPAFGKQILRSYHHPEVMTASTWPDGNVSLISYMKGSIFRFQERRRPCHSMVAALLGASTWDIGWRTSTTTRAWELRRRHHLR